LPSTILTDPPAERIDPPATFTIFVVVVILVAFLIFLYGLTNLKANFNLFPQDGTGVLTNVLFLGVLGAILLLLVKFWISWTFIETIQYFFVIRTSLVS
jgi:hypothetical protein